MESDDWNVWKPNLVDIFVQAIKLSVKENLIYCFSKINYESDINNHNFILNQPFKNSPDLFIFFINSNQQNPNKVMHQMKIKV